MTVGNSNTRQRVLATAFTVAVHLVLFLGCLTTFLQYPNPDMPETAPVVDEENEISFEQVVDLVAGGSYTVPDELTPPEPTPTLSQGSQSEAATVPSPTPQEIQQKKSEEIARRVKFNTAANASQNEGDGGDAPSTSAVNADINTEIIGLDGFTGEGFPRPNGFSSTGTIAISITVDASGHVLATNFLSNRSNGKIIENQRAIKACLDAASRSKLSPRSASNTTGATGIIFYHFKKS